jgi:integrase
MASMYQIKGRTQIQFKGPDNKRRTLRLGKIDDRAAKDILGHVEHLAGCWFNKMPPCKATFEWVSKLLTDPAWHWLYDRLSDAGLVTERDRPDKKSKAAMTKLGPFTTAYIESRIDVEPNTKTNLELSRFWLVKHFGESKPMSEITPGDADEYRRWLGTELGDNSVRRHCGRAKQFFRAAVRKRLIAENPFGDMKKCTVQANKEREFFVTREVTAKALAACPDAQWQLLFALSRYGGLRCPSEHLALTWDDIAWELNRFTVHSPKTKRYEGKESRVVPLFPELRPFLEAVFNETEDRLGRPPVGTDHVITRYRDRNSNLRTQLQRILKRAGVKSWPKLFQNLRASRATELAAQFPAHVAAAWLGHSTLVAQKHYWQVTDADFEKAATPSFDKALQKAMQTGCIALGPGTVEALHGTASDPGKNRVFDGSKVTPTGIEPVSPP